jgi:putative DNA primase/helicase
MYVLGEYAVVPHKSLIVSSKNEHHPTNIAALFRKRLAVTSETKSADTLDEERVKSLTGKDRLTARWMYGNFFDFDPTHTIIIHTNYRPKIKGTDEAIWRRVRLVPWLVTIPEKDRDPYLSDKLKEEAAGILRWVVEGAREFLAKGIDVPESIRVATDDYRQGEDLIGQFMVDMVDVTKVPADITTFHAVQVAAKEWSEGEGLKWSISLNALVDTLESRGAVKGKRVRIDVLDDRKGWVTKQTYEWSGVRLGPFDEDFE